MHHLIIGFLFIDTKADSKSTLPVIDEFTKYVFAFQVK